MLREDVCWPASFTAVTMVTTSPESQWVMAFKPAQKAAGAVFSCQVRFGARTLVRPVP